MSHYPPFSSRFAADGPRLLIAATLAFATAPLAAQWNANVKRNTFVDADCPVPAAALADALALDPVLVPCNDGCFYAWIDSAGRVRIQVIDDCGYRALPSAHLVAGTGFGGTIFGLPSQLAGCAYDDDTTPLVHEKNQLFLAYTTWNTSSMLQELWGNVFTFAVLSGVPTLTPGTPVLIDTAATYHAFLTPVADSSVNAAGDVDGAVLGWREWDPVFASPVTLDLGGVHGSAAAPVLRTPVLTADTFVLPPGAMPPRLSVISDFQGNLFAAWRGHDANLSPPWYHCGTRCDPVLGAHMAGGYPTAKVPTSRTIDDWALAADQAGGVFFAQTNDAGTSIVVGHNDGLGTAPANWGLPVSFATVASGQLVHALAMVEIPPAGGLNRAALFYRDNTSLQVVEVKTGVALGTSALVGSASGTATVRGSAVFAHRNGLPQPDVVAVAWTGDFAVGTTTKLYGQEVETATFATKLWNNGNAKVVSENTFVENKHVPMVVHKYARPEMIYGWVDERTGWQTLGDMSKGAYVQSVADNFMQIVGMGFKKKDGVLGSSVMCLRPIQHFDLHGYTIVTGDPFDPVDPVGGVGSELFRVREPDGTLELVKDINPGVVGSNPGTTVALGAQRIFAATGVDGREPWVTDGTPAGTMQLADCEPGPGGSSPSILGTMQDGVECIFSAVRSGSGRELWRTDGTPAGTAMIVDLLPGGGNGVVSGSDAVVGGNLYFWGNDGVHGIELWRTDGTAAGTMLVADMTPGAGGTSPGSIKVLGDKVAFSCLVAGVGAEPYVLDPVTLSVTLLRDIAPGAASSGPSFLTAAGSFAWFSAAGANGRELWFTDGTPAGTQQVADLHPTGSSNPSNITAGDGFVLFTANDGSHGVELWRSDGSLAGTAMVADIEPGIGSSDPTRITAIGDGRFVFTASSSAAGSEPWVTDGTPAGTMRIADLEPGPGGSNPENFDVVAGTLRFGATIGNEVVTMSLPLDAPARIGQGCRGANGTPRIGSIGALPRPGSTLTVTLADAAPFSFGGLIVSGDSNPITIGGCTLYADLPELMLLLAATDGAGNAMVAIPVPNNPDLVGATAYLQWAVLDAAGPLFGLALSDALSVTVER